MTFDWYLRSRYGVRRRKLSQYEASMLREVSSVIVNFLSWWVAEIKAIFSPAAASGSDRYTQRIVLSVLTDHFHLVDENKKRAPAKIGEYESLDTAASALAKIVRKRPSMPVGIRFSNSDFFVRQMELPASARNDVKKVLDLELERTTPFRPAQVYAAHFIDHEPQGDSQKLVVQQVVIKRRTVQQAVDALSQVGVTPDFVDCAANDGQDTLPVDFLQTTESHLAASGGGNRMMPRLAALSILLAGTAVVTALVRYQAAVDEVSAAVTAARGDARIVRQAVEKSQTVLSQIATVERWRRERIPAAQVVEQLTQLFPDTAYLSDMRLEEGVIEVTGYAQSAAPLIPLIEKSLLFDRVSLAAPVMLDARRDRERFSIRLHLRSTSFPGGVSEPDESMEAR